MLTRTQLAARIAVLRQAMDILCDQSDRDGHGKFFCYRACQVELVRMESDIRAMDHPESLGVALEAELRSARRSA